MREGKRKQFWRGRLLHALAMAIVAPVSIALAAGTVYLVMMVVMAHRPPSGGASPSLMLSLPWIWPALLFVWYVTGLAALAVSLTVAVLVWLPWYLLSLRFGYTSWQAYVTVGFVVSLVLLGLLALPDSPMPIYPLVWRIAVMLAGPAAGIQLWRHVRPDQSTARCGHSRR